MTSQVGSNGNDIMFGTIADESVFGLLGDDTIYVSEGDDVLHGDEGDDRVSLQTASSAVTLVLGSDTSGNGGTAGSATFGAHSADLLEFEEVIGSDFNDNITGNAGDNWISGGAGVDTIDGGAGDDLILMGGVGSGYDRATGGDGADTFAFTLEGSKDKIKDFDTTEDVLQIWDLNDYSEVRARDWGAYIKITKLGGDQGAYVALDRDTDGDGTYDISAADLSIDNFEFLPDM